MRKSLAANDLQFDANHIALTDINLRVDSIYYCDPDIRLNILEASMKEQGGLELKSMTARVAIDSAKMVVDGNLATPASTMALNLKMRPNPVTSLDLDNGEIDGKIVSFKAPYRRLPILDAIKEQTGFDCQGKSEEEIRSACRKRRER